jgi:hypothetical protein
MPMFRSLTAISLSYCAFFMVRLGALLHLKIYAPSKKASLNQANIYLANYFGQYQS